MALPVTIERKRLYTLEEFEELDLPNDGNRYELIDGELIVTPPAGDEHGGIADTIAKFIHRFDLEDRLGRIRESTRYEVMPGFSPAPDVAFVKAERVVPVVMGAVPTRPDLVVEVWSPHDLETQNRREKIRRYQISGVPLIWAINNDS